MRVLVCPPTHYGIEYSINPWMDVQNQSDHRKASLQWQRLVEMIHLLGHEVVEVPPVEGLPDLVFTANAALVWDKHAVVSKFRYPERQGETEVFADWFQKNGFTTIVAPNDFEGAGDALFCGDTLFCGWGFRSSYKVRWFLESLGLKKIVSVELLDDYFYHLDTCFCPLNDKQILWYPPAIDFGQAFTAWEEQELGLEFIAVPEVEAKKFACNAVVLGNDVIMPAGCPETKEQLKSRGFSVMDTEMTEFIKAGGACKCLTLIV